MWCIGRLTVEYRERMYALCELYARPYDPQQPVICVDEKSKQLLAPSRPTLEAKAGQVAKEDYEYERRGTCNIFLAVESKGGHREAAVTDRRTKADFVQFICRLLSTVYATAHLVHLVLDNLNTHFRSSFEEVLGAKVAADVLARVEFHYTPKHARLAQHGGIGNRDYGKAMHRSAHAGASINRQRNRRLATAS